MSLRVLMLNHNIAFKGGATFYRALQLGRSLARLGYDITLVASAADSFWKFQTRNIDGVTLVESPRLCILPPLYGYDLYEVLRRLKWVSRNKYDIVHAFDSRPSVIYPALKAQRLGAKLILDWCDWFGRGGSIEQRTNPLLRVLLRPVETFFEEAFRTKACATTVINSALENRARALGIRSGSIVRLENGSDVDNIIPMDRDQARAKLGLPVNLPILGYEGSFFQQDAELLLEAWRQVRTVKPETLLLLIGDPKTSVPEMPGVLRAGFVPYRDLSLYLAACDVLCLPLADSIANRGRLPSKITDYFAAHRPTVVCDVGDVGTMVRSANAGLVSRPTAKDLADRVLDLLADPELSQRLGTNARHAAETDFSWNTVAQRVDELYLKLTAM